MLADLAGKETRTGYHPGMKLPFSFQRTYGAPEAFVRTMLERQQDISPQLFLRYLRLVRIPCAPVPRSVPSRLPQVASRRQAQGRR